VFRDQLFPSTTEPTADIAAVQPGDATPPAKADAPPPVDPQAGQPTTPEIQPAGTPTTAPPGPTPPAVTPPPTAVPPGTPPAATPTATTAGTVPPTATPTAAPPVPPTATPGTPTPPAAGGSAKLDEARALYTAAKGGSKRKKLEQARTILQEILAATPREGQALLLLAQIELELGDAKAALATATTCTEAAPELADCWLTIGVLQQDKNDKAAAATAYEKYLALAPDGRYAGDVRKQLARLKK
jgi:hypothetical protein